MNIEIEIIDHHEQRYDTVGDWDLNFETKTLKLRISNLGNWRYNFLVTLHEMCEAALCLDREITTEVVDQFDLQFEENRDVGNIDEPGDDPKAPYRKEHFFATNLERLMAAELRVDWAKYEEEINNLEY